LFCYKIDKVFLHCFRVTLCRQKTSLTIISFFYTFVIATLLRHLLSVHSLNCMICVWTCVISSCRDRSFESLITTYQEVDICGKKLFSCCNDDNKRTDSCIDLPEQHFLRIIKRLNKSIRRWITVIWILLCWNELSSQNCRSTYFIEDSPTLVNLVKWAENVFSSRFNSLVLVYWIFSLFYERINMINLGSISESFNELSLQESI